MKNSTLVRIKVPKALYESALEKALLEANEKNKKDKEVKTHKKGASEKKLTNELSIDGTIGPTPDEIKLTYQIAAGIIGGFSVAGALVALKNLKDKAKATPAVLKMVAKDVLKKGAKPEEVAKAAGLKPEEVEKLAGGEQKVSEMKAHKMMSKK